VGAEGAEIFPLNLSGRLPFLGGKGTAIMIESVAAVERVEAVSIAVASGLAARNGRKWREKRLQFLGALRSATGDAGALGDVLDDDLHRGFEDARLPARARIAEAQERIALIDAVDSAVPDGPVDVAGTVRRIAEAGTRSIAIQARIGAAGVERLVTAGSR
jgi:glutathione S-transferase